jgi:hypothetical protein
MSLIEAYPVHEIFKYTYMYIYNIDIFISNIGKRHYLSGGRSGQVSQV